MNTRRPSLFLPLFLALMAATAAHAGEPSAGKAPEEIRPGQHPVHTGTPAPKTREQVKAELYEAIRLGEIPIDDSSLRPRDRNPWAYPKDVVAR
jgi:hypothetical protein